MNSPLPSFFSDARLTIIDVGARGGLSWQWAPFKHLITTVLVEPDPAEAAALVEKLKGEGLGGVKVIPKGLGARNGTAELNLLRNPECSSILEPNLPWLARFPESERFTTAKRIPIELSTLDSELAALGVTQCDFLKLDVQGYELEVLAGASAAVRQCLVLEAETSFSEIYKGQPLFAQIDSALRQLGFSLIDLERVWWRRAKVPPAISTRGQIIWANSLYLRDPWDAGDFTREKLAKIAIILCAYRLFDIVHELLRLGVEKGVVSAEELTEVADWMACLSYARSPLWSFIARLPHFPFKRRITRFFGMLARSLRGEPYGEGVGVDGLAWERKWDWL